MAEVTLGNEPALMKGSLLLSEQQGTSASTTLHQEELTHLNFFLYNGGKGLS